MKGALLFLGRLLARWESLLIVAIIGVGIWSATLSPFFFVRANLLDLLTPYAFIGLMALGLGFVVIAGEIDISVASILAVSVVCFSQFYDHGAERLARAAGGPRRRDRSGLHQWRARRNIRPAVTGNHARHPRRLPGPRIRDPSGRGSGCLSGERHQVRRRLRGRGAADRLARAGRHSPSRSGLSSMPRASGAISTRSDRIARPRGFAGVPVARVRVTVFAISGFMAGIAGSCTSATSDRPAPMLVRARCSTSSPRSFSEVSTSSEAGARCSGSSSHSFSLPSYAMECSSRTSPATRRTSSSEFCFSRRSSSATSPARSRRVACSRSHAERG